MVLGLDLSLTGTGYVVLKDDVDVYGHGRLKNKLMGMSRLHYIRAQIESILTNCEPTLVAIEGYSMGARAGMAFNIGELGGVIRLLLLHK